MSDNEKDKLLQQIKRIIEERDAFKMCLQKIAMRCEHAHIEASKTLQAFKEVV